jgi:hypothetical protein
VAGVTPARPRRGLAIAAALILVVGVGGALAVLQPWAGDSVEPAAAQPTDTDGATGQPTLASGGPGGAEPPAAAAVDEPSSTTTTPDDGGAAEPSTSPTQPAPSGPTPTPAAPTVASVDVSGPAGPLLPGATARLTARALDARGQAVPGQAVQWRSSDAAVASVDGGGTVSANRPGRAVITASAAGVSASWDVAVGEAPVARVTLQGTTLTLEVGREATLRAETRATDGEVLTGRQITWTSSNPAVAQVSAAGVVTAAAAGTATVTAASEGQTADADVTVRVPLRTAVEEVVAAYARALESRTIERIRAVYPDMTPEREQQLQRSLPTMDGLRVEYEIASIEEQTSLATAQVNATYRFRSGGRDFVQPTPLHFTFSRTSTSWRVTAIQ